MEQISVFDLIPKLDYEMYDGFKVEKDVAIKLRIGGIFKIVKGIYYFMTRYKSEYTIALAFPNQYGGSLVFTVTEEQFQKYFKSLGQKVYPNKTEIWNGENWIINPNLKTN